MSLQLDTNAVVALVVADRQEQREAVLLAVERAVSAGDCVVVSEAVLVESFWVLQTRYGLSEPEVADRLRAILSAGGVEPFDARLAETALLVAQRAPALSIVDCLLVARAEAHGDAVLTFDKRLAREVSGL